MLDSAVILTKSGIVLWKHEFVPSVTDPIQSLFDQVLLAQKSAEYPHGYQVGSHRLCWSFANDYHLIFIIVYQNILQLSYAQDLLTAMNKHFCSDYGARVKELTSLNGFDFDRKFQLLLQGFTHVSKSQNHEPVSSKPIEKKKGKEKRTWNDSGKIGEVDDSLDFSGHSSQAGSTQSIPTHLVDASSLGNINEDGLYDAKELDVPDTSKSYTSSISKFFSSIASGKSINETQLVPIIQKIQEHLVHKNVATEISKMIGQSITQHLVGKNISTFSSLEAFVKSEFEKSLERILTPKASTDLLKEANQIIQKEARPYVITFVGVNGVGKSTNLSKICFWLLQNRKRVLIAACDTFRSGAVEQLRVHVRNLMALNDNGSVVELFEKGYGKDSASIAKDAIQYAKLRNFDFVLVDTAGRMQDNEPLMRALSKLVALNQPDKVLFVGEALVGNEAVDQLTRFNRAFKDFSQSSSPRQIDGMILTKFDTIDDKVGAALSMTYLTGKPIYFVGTGQTYTDLRKLNVKSVVASLLSA